MIIDYFPVLFSTVLFSTLLHCHYFNKIMQLEKRCLFLMGVIKCAKMTFLGSCSPEKDFFPFTAMFYHRSEGYIVASFLTKTPILCWRYKTPADQDTCSLSAPSGYECRTHTSNDQRTRRGL